MYYTKEWTLVKLIASGIELMPGSIIPYVKQHHDIDPIRGPVTKREIEEAKATLTRLIDSGKWNEDWTIKI